MQTPVRRPPGLSCSQFPIAGLKLEHAAKTITALSYLVATVLGPLTSLSTPLDRKLAALAFALSL